MQERQQHHEGSTSWLAYSTDITLLLCHALHRRRDERDDTPWASGLQKTEFHWIRLLSARVPVRLGKG